MYNMSCITKQPPGSCALSGLAAWVGIISASVLEGVPGKRSLCCTCPSCTRACDAYLSMPGAHLDHLAHSSAAMASASRDMQFQACWTHVEAGMMFLPAVKQITCISCSPPAWASCR